MKTTTNSISGLGKAPVSQSFGMKIAAQKFFTYAIELAVLFVLIFASVSAFAQEPASKYVPAGGGTLELVKQTATFNSGKIYLNWVTPTNSINCMYVIERSTDGSEYEPVGLKEGIGSSVELLYSWVDTKPSEGANYYRIKQINDNGNLLAESKPQEINTPQNPLFMDKSSRMVMAK